jgi:hypothetical protein
MPRPQPKLGKLSPSPIGCLTSLVRIPANDHQNPIPHRVDSAPSPRAALFPEAICEARGVLFRAEKSAAHSAMKFPPPALSIQGKRRNPSPHEDLFVKIAAVRLARSQARFGFPFGFCCCHPSVDASAESARKTSLKQPSGQRGRHQLRPPIPSSFAVSSLPGRLGVILVLFQHETNNPRICGDGFSMKFREKPVALMR